METSGPCGNLGDTQPQHNRFWQGAVRREWQAISKDRNAVQKRLCYGPSGEAVRARLYVVFLGKGWAITGKTRLDSHPHSLSEYHLNYRMDHYQLQDQ